MSNPLLIAIQQVQEHIRQHRELLENNKRQTIRALIDPILAALSWSNADIHRLRYDFPAGDGIVDMALFRQYEPVAFLDVKSLDTILGSIEREKLGQLAFQQSVPLAIVTNGAEWQLSLIFHQHPHFEQQRILYLSLGSDEGAAQQAAEQLSLLKFQSVDHLETECWRILLERIWDEQGGSTLMVELSTTLQMLLARNLRIASRDIPIDAVQTLMRDKLAPRLVQTTSPQRNTNYPSRRSHATRPAAPNPTVILSGERIPIQYKYEILVQTAEWLIRLGKLHPEHAPISHKGGITAAVYHKDSPPARPSARLRELSNGLILDVNWVKKNLVARAHTLLERYGYPPETLQLEGFGVEKQAPPKQNRRPLSRDRAKRHSSAHSRNSNRAIILAGRRYPLQYQYEILSETVEWLIRRGFLEPNECPIFASKMATNRYLIHTEPIHSNGKPFGNQKKLSNGTFLSTWGNLNTLINRTRRLLRRCGYPPDTLQLEGFTETKTAQYRRPSSVPARRPVTTRTPADRAVILAGECIRVRSMAEACVAVANWLIARGHLKHVDCPIYHGSQSLNRYFIHTEPLHPNGRSFFLGKRLANGLFIEAHARRDHNYRYLTNLLTRHDYPTNTLQLSGFDD